MLGIRIPENTSQNLGYLLTRMELEKQIQNIGEKFLISGQKSPIPASKGQKLEKPIVENYF